MNNSNYIRRLFYVAILLTPAQIKPKLFESRRNSFFFLARVDALHVYVCAWALGCFHSLISTGLLEGADRVAGQLRGDRVPLQWRKQIWQSLEEGAGKWCSECASAYVRTTLRASLSGTFLQTLPDLVTPLKGHSLSPRSCPAPSERYG